MDDRTRNILIGILVLFAAIGAGSAFILPHLAQEAGQGGPGAADHARGRRLMEEGKFGEAQIAFLQVIQQYQGTPVAGRAQADKDFGIPFTQALRLAEAGQAAQAQAILGRVAREGSRTEWGPRATNELSRLSQQGPASAGPAPAGPREGIGPAPAGAPEPSRQARLAQANSLLEEGRTEEARGIYRGLADEGVNDPVGSAAQLTLTTLQAANGAARGNPEVDRARVALHRARASLLGYRGANGQYPASLQDRGLDQFGFSYQDLLADLRRVESYRPEGGARFEITAVARDARGTRLRATERAVEDLP